MDDDDDLVFALTRRGHVLHLVLDIGLRTDADIIGRKALCGQRVAREVHPSDHYEGGRVCRRCNQFRLRCVTSGAGTATGIR